MYKNFDYWLKFNNQNAIEEKNVKLLLNMPLIPRRYHKDIKLVSKLLELSFNCLFVESIPKGDQKQNSEARYHQHPSRRNNGKYCK